MRCSADIVGATTMNSKGIITKAYVNKIRTIFEKGGFMFWKTAGILMMAIVAITPSAIGVDSSQSSTISIAVQNIFAMEFYTDSNVLYRDVVPFTNVDPNKSIVYPDGRSENDGKSDTAVICKSNAGTRWYLKLHIISNEPLTADKVRYYISQPFNRNTGGQADGALARSPQWYPFSATPDTIYVSGANDTSNLPFGTLTTFNFSLVPTGLSAGQAYSATVVYTMTTTP